MTHVGTGRNEPTHGGLEKSKIAKEENLGKQEPSHPPGKPGGGGSLWETGEKVARVQGVHEERVSHENGDD